MAYDYPPRGGQFSLPDQERQRLVYLESEKQRKRAQQAAAGDFLSQMESQEYGEEILLHMLDTEAKTLPDVASIDIQTEIQWYMRPYLLDFLIEAHAAFTLLPETLFLAINILDRYCSRRVVYRRHYQLVGCTALLIAAKYGECPRKIPRIKELAHMCCSLYDEDMFTQMERHVMITLDWSIGAPTVDGFVQMALDDKYYDAEVEHMALYMSEIALFHRDFVSTKPSDLAKASLALARIVLEKPHPQECHWASTHDSAILVLLSQQLHRPSQILAQKYKTSHFARVSNTLEDFLARHAAVSRANATLLPTPTSDIGSSSQEVCNGASSLQTPQKGQYPANMPHGCPTPPITPESDTKSFYPQPEPNLPVTPTSATMPPHPLVVGIKQDLQQYSSHSVIV